MKYIKFILSAIVGAAMSVSAMADTLSIGTNQQGSLFFSIGTAISKVMVEKTKKQFRVAPYAGSSTYIPLIDQGRLAFGLSNGGEATFAYTGKELFEGKPNKNLRLIGVAINTASGFAVPSDSKYKTVADLKGAKISSQYTSGRIFDYYSKALMSTAGLTYADFKTVPTPNFVTAINNFAQGRVDAAIVPFNAGVGKKAMATMKGGWRYVTIEAEGERANVAKILPSSRLVKKKPGKKATGVKADPTTMIELDFFVIGGAHVPDDVVYETVKTMYNNKAALKAAFGAFARFKPEAMATKNPVPYHPGAIKFYKEMGVWPK
ncbi:TAXI family TRAP transporter solute-binding subunit [Pseudomonadota bacterium]